MNKNNGNKFSPGSTRAGCASSAGASRGQLGGNWGHPPTDGVHDRQLGTSINWRRARWAGRSGDEGIGSWMSPTAVGCWC